MTLDAPSPHKYSYLWPHIEGPCLGGFKVPVTMGTNPLSYPAHESHAQHECSATLNDFSGMLLRGFIFHALSFFRMISWEMFKSIP